MASLTSMSWIIDSLVPLSQLDSSLASYSNKSKTARAHSAPIWFSYAISVSIADLHSALTHSACFSLSLSYDLSVSIADWHSGRTYSAFSSDISAFIAVSHSLIQKLLCYLTTLFLNIKTTRTWSLSNSSSYFFNSSSKYLVEFFKFVLLKKYEFLLY
jgi:hypothetical protein